jgi:FkbM family methyltransferase
MTSKLSFQDLPLAAVARKHPLTYFDIGSRGGLQNDLHPIAFAVDAIGFEPDPAEFERLHDASSGPWKSFTLLPSGVSGKTGPRRLYIPDDPQSASLLEHDTSIGEKFDKPQFFNLERMETVETVSLPDALQQSGLDRVDYLKIDIEGAELEIFRSSETLMANVLAVKTEVSFIPLRKNQPLAVEVDGFLRRNGFELMDIITPAHWRRHGYLIHPYYSTESPPYSRAQIVQADYLMFRDPESLADDTATLLRLSLIALSFGYFDHALMILERPGVSAYLDQEFGLSPETLVAPASKRYGRAAFLGALYQQFRGAVPFVRYLMNLLR